MPPQPKPWCNLPPQSQQRIPPHSGHARPDSDAPPLAGAATSSGVKDQLLRSLRHQMAAIFKNELQTALCVLIFFQDGASGSEERRVRLSSKYNQHPVRSKHS